MSPLFFAALAFAAGIVLATTGYWHFAWLLAGAAACLLLVRRRRAAAWALLPLLAWAGSGWYRHAAAHPTPTDSLQRTLAAWHLGPREKIVVGGYLRDDPRRAADYTRFDLETEFLIRQGLPANVHGGLRVYVDEPAGALPRAGQAVEFAAHPRPLRRYLDPGVADFNRAARLAGIDATASVSAAVIERLAVLRGPVWERWRAALWRRLSVAVDRLAPPAGARASPALNALLRGMLLGDTSRLNESTRQDFQVNGIYHVLVVAGLHIGILALFFVWGLRRLGLNEIWAGGLCLALLAVYAWTISGRTPTLRVLLMLAIYFVARAWYRQRQALNAVGAAALILLVARPAALFAPGFQMSFGAAALLAGVVGPHFARGPRLWRRATRRLGDIEYDASFPPRWAQRRLELRAWRSALAGIWRPLGAVAPVALRATANLYEVVCVAFILQWGLAAFMAVYFHRATPWAAAVNAVVVPAVGLLLPAAWALAGLELLAGGWAWAAAMLAAAAALPRALGHFVLWMAHAAARWPLAAARVPTPPNWALALFAAAFALWLLAARRGGRRFAVATALVAATALALAWLPFPPRLSRGALTVTTLDVGQGDAIFVSFPHGRTLLVDAGPKSRGSFDAGEEIVAPYLWSRGLRRLDAVLLTHAHSDHMGGMPFVLRTFHPHELWVTRTLPAEPAVAALLRQAASEGVRVERRRQGERFRVGGCELDILWPSAAYRAGATAKNQDSMVVRIVDGAGSALLEGDAEAAQERQMLASGLPLASTLLKVGHHGSRSSSIPPFLAAVHPAVATISVGAGNMYGHPAPLVLAHLAAAGAQVFRTDRGGAIEAQFRDGMLRVFRFRPRD